MGAVDLIATADEPTDAVRAAGEWFVLHTLSRQEKAVAADLRALDVPYFLPLVKTIRYYGRRKIATELPLFPGYVFMRGAVEQAYEIDRAKRLAQIITVHDQSQLDDELRSIESALAGGATLDPYPYLKVGIECVVRSGPCKGVRGFIESRAKNDRLILTIEILGRSTSMEIDAALLEPVHHAPAGR